jgi:hypothetical protein
MMRFGGCVIGLYIHINNPNCDSMMTFEDNQVIKFRNAVHEEKQHQQHKRFEQKCRSGNLLLDTFTILLIPFHHFEFANYGITFGGLNNFHNIHLKGI